MKIYQNVKELIEKLNASGEPYLILRNFDNLYGEGIFMDGHGDIDMLCADSSKVARILELQSSRPDGRECLSDGTHFHTYVGGRYVSMDLRHIGDGYYCTSWQESMLKQRVLHTDGFYIMNPEDLFYSLIYHAILQKKGLSEEYKRRLRKMAEEIDVSLLCGNSKEFISLLDKFMANRHYRYTYTKDICVPCRFHLVEKSLIERNVKLYFRHFLFNLHGMIIEFLIKIKHAFHL